MLKIDDIVRVMEFKKAICCTSSQIKPSTNSEISVDVNVIKYDDLETGEVLYKLE